MFQRGLGSRKKRRVVKDFLRSEKPDIVMIQETKKAECDRRLWVALWTARNKDGQSFGVRGFRGDLVMWDSKSCTVRRWIRFLFGLSQVCSGWSEQFGYQLSMAQIASALRKDFGRSFRHFLSFSPAGELWEVGGGSFKEMVGGHKFMRKLQFLKAKLKEWNKNALHQRGNFKVFEKLYASPSGESWRVEGLDWSPISSESASRLESPFTEEEISKAIFQMDRDKAPGPDGFTIAVFQDCWDVIKEDLVRVFDEFHRSG
ncbi:hypothetical protein CK203_017852 [Vitis vinifera]|uniref:Endonuclease/exonuclease/phosphatase domain-containing protein n=1 Tax=Vitis vinifera TaxID=29760 RepID=A0A438JW75_VITVI|nr:hypothetical protein CK203_017852 [Vitis vinifera]